jgi:hypothetical protein
MGQTGGQACQNTWEACQDLLNNKWASSSNPLFSIVIPISENEEFNENQILLTSTQSAVAIEIIFVVHCENEHINKLEQFSKNLGFFDVKVVKQQSHDIWGQFKTGASHATGDYIVYQNIWAQLFRNPFYFADQILSNSPNTDVLWPSDTQEDSHLNWKKQASQDFINQDDLEQVAFQLLKKNKLTTSTTKPKEIPNFFVIKKEKWTSIQESNNWLANFNNLKHSQSLGILIQQPAKNTTDSLKRLIPTLISSSEKIDFPILSEALQGIQSDSLNAIIGTRLLHLNQNDSALKILMSSIPNDYIGEWGALKKCIQILKESNSPVPNNLYELDLISSKLNSKFNLLK